MNGLHILVADDDPNQCNILSAFLSHLGAKVTCAEDAAKAIQILEGPSPVQLLISDLSMPGMNGLELIREAKQRRDELTILLITANGSIETAIQATKMGACDYIQKPIVLEELELRISKALQNKALRHKANILEQENLLHRKNPDLIYQSPKMTHLFEDIEKVQQSDCTVLLTGETGVGKEVIAKYIHAQSERSKGPFIAINCSAIPENLTESQFFGHEKGSFTGADRRMLGSFELADGGTLFLDEIGDMDLKLQAKILRAIEERQIHRLGSPTETPVNVRIIAATNKNLRSLVDEKMFREDLFYRLKVVHFEIPPLRERREDIEPLTVELVKKSNSQRFASTKIEAEFIEALKNYPFPGNVRELRNIIERALLFAKNETLTTECLPAEIRHLQTRPEKLPSNVFELRPTQLATANPNQNEQKSLNQSVGDFEKNLILQRLGANQGDVDRTARELQISKSALYAKLSKYRAS